MNTITQIEIALRTINQASFQTLINHLLFLQGYNFISAPGATVGKEKTSKGSPDSYFVNDDKYIFVECTTQERVGNSKSFFDKLSKDIDHCFQEEKTKISNGKIAEVVLACNEKVSSDEYEKLNARVKGYNSNTTFKLITIQSLSYDLFEVPKLASEYLNIDIVKGDIYTLEQFLLKTEKGLQPSLTNEFIGRENVLEGGIEILRKFDILLLSGGAGVGKSKLAVKILEELSNENFVPIVIQSSGVSLWDDYQHLFLPNKHHIVLFDDANKSINNLNYLLSKVTEIQSFTVKVIITSRDYVKKEVVHLLNNHFYKELNIPEFKDEEIEKIITSALPDLKYNNDIKRKIVELSKGNARLALMATYSVTPDAETNYLDSPVLLYEKYFKKISDDIAIFKSPIILQSLAIVSFFGVLDKKNEELENVLKCFNIEWNDLWTSIMELHNNEILDVYSNEIVKVSDQVLGTYSFYKCFIDDKSALINYAKWIEAFLKKFSNRIRSTLIDVNNTFDYYHIKELVVPHLDEVLESLESDDQFYAFYELFWFYKGRNCLLYLKKWIGNLNHEQKPEKLNFDFVHNDHTYATKHFDLLKDFWNHPNELLKPSLELTLVLLNKEPSRLPEILKFIHEGFKYKIEDLENGYLRQSILLDILLEENLIEIENIFANGIFLKLSEVLLGWHYDEFRSGKGRGFNIYNFDLYKSEELMRLRERILKQFYNLFDLENEQVEKVLNKIIYPGGDIDKSIFSEELPIYRKLISDKLDNTQYSHCKFVCVLAKHVTETGIDYPEDWNEFIESDIRKLSKFLKPDWEYREDKSIEESEKEKRKEFDDFVKANDWAALEKFLLNISSFYRQQKEENTWHVEFAVTNIYASIARKNKADFKSALRLFFSGKAAFPLRTTIINVALLEDVMTGREFMEVLNEHDFHEKIHWEFQVLTVLPREQVGNIFFIRLLEIFQSSKEYIHIHRMSDYMKYEAVFEEFKTTIPELKNHNFITFLTSLILIKKRKTRHAFGINFCSDYSLYFTGNQQIFKEAFWAQYEIYPNFDYNGIELKAILDIDKNFINDNLKNGRIGLGHSAKIRLEKINTYVLWQCDDYAKLIEDIILTALEKEKFNYIVEKDILSLFSRKKSDEVMIEKAKILIMTLVNKHSGNERFVLILIEIVYNNFRTWFIDFFKEFLLTNKDINVLNKVMFGRTEFYSGSRVPMIQKKIEFYQDILKMVNSLPNLLDYSEHIDFFEQKIKWKKQDILDEQRRDFMDEFN
ncbi:hypothetical protein OHD16_10445 [Sphingobacterium sp. ML3W]|uniref:nSTAND3 domain-containing NTPase n=1 Tax=Sphingobacterium sp. ML3W TaxID=1538644 RepID=UPI00249C2B29|nr:hypothetical protein [Sphingobacterium sp. ML3W]WFA80379.1 hypothetical protein OGI71_03590 [Sphingobacterium sp. ML3W]